MILLSSAVRLYVAVEPLSMRRSFDGLMAQVRAVLALDPLSGHVFAFINRRKPLKHSMGARRALRPHVHMHANHDDKARKRCSTVARRMDL